MISHGLFLFVSMPMVADLKYLTAILIVEVAIYSAFFVGFLCDAIWRSFYSAFLDFNYTLASCVFQPYLLPRSRRLPGLLPPEARHLTPGALLFQPGLSQEVPLALPPASQLGGGRAGVLPGGLQGGVFPLPLPDVPLDGTLPDQGSLEHGPLFPR